MHTDIAVYLSIKIRILDIYSSKLNSFEDFLESFDVAVMQLLSFQGESFIPLREVIDCLTNSDEHFIDLVS